MHPHAHQPLKLRRLTRQHGSGSSLCMSPRADNVSHLLIITDFTWNVHPCKAGITVGRVRPGTSEAPPVPTGPAPDAELAAPSPDVSESATNQGGDGGGGRGEGVTVRGHHHMNHSKRNHPVRQISSSNHLCLHGLELQALLSNAEALVVKRKSRKSPKDKRAP